MKLYTIYNVWEATLSRMREMYETGDNVMLSCSGGKDSTVMLEMAIMVAREFDRLPLVVSFLDQESEYQGTRDYMRYLADDRKEDIDLYWWQVPFCLTNSTQRGDESYLHCWSEKQKHLWMRPKEHDTIHENPTDEIRFHALFPKLHHVIWNDEPYLDMVGIRADESMGRLVLQHKNNPIYRNIRWASCEGKKGYKFYPIYDWRTPDIWKAIYENEWKYNVVYDRFYQVGMSTTQMRVSSLIHEQGHWGIEHLQDIEPATYNRLSQRLDGVGAYNIGGQELYVPKELPSAFGSWCEYRDYLLEALIVVIEHKHKFIKRFIHQPGERWAAQHVREIILNDFEGVTNKAARLNEDLQKDIITDVDLKENYEYKITE